ncbi:MAG: hypothetical protein [Apis nora virus 2]|nr:MAG: hypothetical protein [Apis nora virus 2]
MSTPTGEVQAEGVSTLEVAAPVATGTVGLTPAPQTPAPKQKTAGKKKAGTKKNQTGAVNQRFFPVAKFTVGGEPTTNWTSITIDPYTLTSRGEAFNLPWRRNVWTGGDMSMGYLTTLMAQVHVARPPQVSGIVEFSDGGSLYATSYFVDFGGRLDFPLVPRRFEAPGFLERPRYWNQPVLRTNEAQCILKYRLIAFNRTADIADVKVDVFVRPGFSTFHTPTKPKNRTSNMLTGLWEEEIEQHCASDEMCQCHLDNSSDSELEPEDHIAPPPGDQPEEGAIDYLEQQDDDLDQDYFNIRVWEGMLRVGETQAIPLVLPSITDVSSMGDENVIRQKFERFAHVVPTQGGSFGPEIGEYTIHTRLPTGVAASLAHVCLPGDMSDEAALRLFGLSSVLDIAGSALASIGGPLLSGFVQTAPAIVKEVLPGPIGSIAESVIPDLASKLLGGVLGGTSGAETSEPVAIGGKIPIARYLQFLKPVVANYVRDPVFSTLLVDLIDLFGDSQGRQVTEIPVSVYVRMRGNVERSVFQRTYIPEALPNTLILPDDRIGYVLEEFAHNKRTFVQGSLQNTYFKKFLYVARNRPAYIDALAVSRSSVPPDFAASVDDALLTRSREGIRALLTPARGAQGKVLPH